MRKKVSFLTLGCKVNQYDTQALRERMDLAGYEILGSWDAEENNRIPKADFYVVNTCTVTEVAAGKSRKLIQKILKEHKNSEVLVTGCFVGSDREELENTPGLKFVLGNENKGDLLSLLQSGKKSDSDLPPENHRDVFDLGISRFEGHTRAFLKVEDGCDLNCSFCIIPKVRGQVLSRSLESSLAEARRLVENGHREIVVTGIHVGAFGKNQGSDLAQLFDRMAEIEGLERIRLSSIEANELTPKLLSAFVGNPKVVPHFHIPLQAGADAVLVAMRRRYNTSQYAKTIEALRKVYDNPALTTDIIVGFPGESDAFWREGLAFMEKMEFSKVHIFPYSVRRGTDAEALPDKNSQSVIRQRVKELDVLEKRMALIYKKKFIGQNLRVLVERGSDSHGRRMGFTERYSRVHFEGDESLRNTFVSVRAEKAFADHIMGTLLPETVESEKTELEVNREHAANCR